MKDLYSKLFVLIIIGISMCGGSSLYAQDSLRTGIKYGFLPALSFNSDNGVYLGAEVKRYDYRDMVPFRSYTRFAFSYQTIGVFNFSVYRDQVKNFGTDIRVGYDLNTNQSFSDYHLGDTEKNPVDRPRFDSTSYYNFKAFKVNVGGSTRFPISLGEGIERMDLLTGLRFVYEKPWGTPENRYLYEQDLTGADGAFLTFLELGWVLERRNNEFRAQQGYYVNAGTKIAPPLISTHTTAEFYTTMLGYLPIFKDDPSLTLAGIVRLRSTVGDTPYWFMPYLGDGSTLRGYMYRRFSSDNSLSYSVELRSWLLKIPFKNIELGVNLFADGGRVFTNENWDSIFNEHKLTLGFGGVMSIFTPDYILKYDIGFSDDGIGIYLGTGYSF
ncbi:MAG TPA: hypothetical protein DEQ34_07045 [Balneolaceae bacterium]|nr:hypothetical protein [Balneolaceae bacterium]